MIEPPSRALRSLFFSIVIFGAGACGRAAPIHDGAAAGRRRVSRRSAGRHNRLWLSGRTEYRARAHLLDEQGKFVGDLPKWSVFAIPVSPGPHMFVLMEFDHRKSDIVLADVRAGSIYYVDVIDGIHPLSNQRRPYFWASRQGGDPAYFLSTLPEHLKKCAWLKPDAEAGDRFVALHAADIQEVMKDANEEKKAGQDSGMAVLRS